MNINDILGLDSKAYDSNYNDYQNWKCTTPLQAKQAIKEIVEGVLKMASDEVEASAVVDKQSILNVKDKIKF